MTSPAIETPQTERPLARPLAQALIGLTLRYVFLLTGSWPRFVEMIYWPMINMTIWGFTSLYILKEFNHSIAVSGIFVAGVLLNEVFFRATVGMMMLFLEDVWARNLGHMFASPLTFTHYIIGIMWLSLLRVIVSIPLAVVVAAWLFHYRLWDLGLPLIPLLALLIVSGWSFGMLMIALLLRFGLAAEWTAWMLIWFIVPFVAPYYPVSILPDWLQVVSWSLPPTYVFECMKALVSQSQLREDYLLISLGLNVIYLAISALILRRAYHGARKRGGLLQVGE